MYFTYREGEHSTEVRRLSSDVGKTNTKTARELHVVDCSEGFVQVDDYNNTFLHPFPLNPECLQHV